MYAYIFTYGLLVWLTDCGPDNPRIAVFQGKLQESSSCSVYKAGCLRWSSVYVRIPKKSALMPVKGCLSSEQNDQREWGLTGKSQSFSLLCHLHPLPDFRWVFRPK